MTAKDDTTGVRIHRQTKKALDSKEKTINAARKTNKLLPLTKIQVLDIAVKNLTIEQGVNS